MYILTAPDVADIFMLTSWPPKTSHDLTWPQSTSLDLTWPYRLVSHKIHTPLTCLFKKHRRHWSGIVQITKIQKVPLTDAPPIWRAPSRAVSPGLIFLQSNIYKGVERCLSVFIRVVWRPDPSAIKTIGGPWDNATEPCVANLFDFCFQRCV